jgi:CubicO group peptidase (beta-lactamase class C family)
MADYILDTLQSFVDKKLAAGVSALITVEGKKEIFHCAGLADLQSRRPFARDAILRMYSTTKPMTATAVMTLVEEGVFSLDMPISRFLPEWKDVKVCVIRDGKPVLEPAKREITVFDLLTMTSGIPYPSDDPTEDPVMKEVTRYYGKALRHIAAQEALGKRISTREVIRMMAGCPLLFHPGERWKYGFSADVLGALIVAATGKELGVYMKEKILDPLHMADTGFRVPKEKLGRIAPTYAPGKNGLVRMPKKRELDMIEEGSFESGGGGLFSTVDDYTRFARMLLNRGELDGVRILKPETVDRMTRNQLTAEQRLGCTWADENGYGYGFQMRVMMDPRQSSIHESIGSFGWNGLAGVSMRIDPVRRTTLLFGIQRIPPSHELFIPDLTEAVEKKLGF